jgi:hypothetical protein
MREMRETGEMREPHETGEMREMREMREIREMREMRKDAKDAKTRETPEIAYRHPALTGHVPRTLGSGSHLATVLERLRMPRTTRSASARRRTDGCAQRSMQYTRCGVLHGSLSLWK